MMGHRQVEQAALFYEFSLERHIPPDHLLRSIDRFVELDDLRRELAGFYSSIGRPSVDPELMIRMLLIGYCFGIRSERRLCEEVHLNLAYRWFCRLGLDGAVPDHSTFSKNRHGRESDLFRRVFETVLRRCIQERWAKVDSFDQQIREAEAKIATKVADHDASKPRLAIAREIEDVRGDLFKRGVGSKVSYYDSVAQRLQIERDMQLAANEQLELEETFKRLKADKEAYLAEFRQQVGEDLVQARRDRDAAAKQLEKAARRNLCWRPPPTPSSSMSLNARSDPS